MIISVILLLAVIFFIYTYIKFILKGNERIIFIAALALKISAGLAMGYIYRQHFGGGDSELYFSEAKKIHEFCHDNDVSVLSFLFDTKDADLLYSRLMFRSQPRALFFNKIVFMAYEVSWGSFWLIGIYLSLVSFSGFWILYRVLARHFINKKTILVLALFFWPSVVFWSSGLIKESVSTFLILIIISLVLLMTKTAKRNLLYLVIAIIFSYFLFKIKYYYAAILIPTLFTYYICRFAANKVQLFRQKFYPQILLYVSLFTLLIFAASHLHPNLRLENVLAVIVTNYHLFEAKSQPGKMIEFAYLSPEFSSFLFYFPKALFAGLFRPNLFDVQNIWSALAGIENFVLLISAILQIGNLKKLKSDYLLLVVAAILYCGLAATFLSFSSPNLGTLVRYKAGFLPVLLLLVYYQNPLFKIGYKKGPKS